VQAFIPKLSIAILAGFALAGSSTSAKPACETLAKDTVVNVSARIKGTGSTGNGEDYYDLDRANLPCELAKLDGATVYVPESARPTCRVGQVMTVSGPSKFDPGFMGVGGVHIQARAFSCR